MKLSQQALVLIAVPLFFQFVLSSAMAYMLYRAEQAAKNAVQARHVKESIDQVNRDQLQLLRQLILLKVSDQRDLRKFNQLARAVPEHLKKLHDDMNASPELKELADQLHDSEVAGLSIISEARACLYETDDIRLPLMLRKFHVQFDRTIEQSGALNEKITLYQERQHKSEMERQNEATIAIAIGLMVDVLAAVLIAIYFNNGTAKRMDHLMENTMRLPRGETLLPRLVGEDELSKLDNLLHEVTSELREAHRKEREIIDNAVDLIFSLSADGRFLAINPAVEAVLGFTQDELRGRRISSLLGDNAEYTLDQLTTARTSHSTVRFEGRIQHKDGNFIDVAWSAAAPEQQDTLFCVLHDISDRKVIERKKQEFVAMVSHDLRTPLTSIMLFLESMTDGTNGKLSRTMEDRVKALTRTTKGLVGMVNDLLDLDKLEAGEVQIKLEQTLVEDLIDEAIEQVREFAADNKCEIVSNCPDGLKTVCDFDKIVRVIVNLLSNAVKFSDSNTTVSISAFDKEDGVEIAVSDSGRGIPEDEIDSIFERWKQIDTEFDTKKKRGSGLGLPICKNIVAMHHGSIGVESQIGNGSKFFFKLPKSPGGRV